jgi:protein SCO1/2
MEKMFAALMFGLTAATLLSVAAAGRAEAQYFRRPVSNIDPKIMIIDEKAHLGSRINPATPLIDADGKAFTWGDMLGKPVILVMSYYTCDGSCSVINANLAGLLDDVTRVVPGSDFRVVTLSFDRHDNRKTTGDFRKTLALKDPLAANWTFATFQNENDLKVETERIGFKFFWSPEDRLFLHPGAFLFFGPDGRLMRVLYQQDVAARDVELAVLDSKQGQFRPREIINLALSICYSYSYHDGKYVLSIPLIVGFGSLMLGLATLFGSIIYYKASRTIKRTRDEDHAQVA